MLAFPLRSKKHPPTHDFPVGGQTRGINKRFLGVTNVIAGLCMNTGHDRDGGGTFPGLTRFQYVVITLTAIFSFKS